MKAMFKPPHRKDQASEQMVFTKSQVMAALQKATVEGQIDYITGTFIRYLLEEGRPLTLEQAKAIGLPVPTLKGNAGAQKMIRIEGDDR